jgi:CRP/FNR family transcriptional regulator, anaerobic regulatory protein
MLHHPLPMPAAGDQGPSPAGALSRRISGDIRCALPRGGTALCGDARHREDRAPGSLVIEGGTRGNDVWFIRSGILRMQRHSYEGRRQILSLFLPGEIVGLERELREGLSIETATASGLCRIERRKFEQMVGEDITLRAELLRQKQDQLDRLHWLTWSLGALTPEERFCAFLALSSRAMPYTVQPDGTGVLWMLLQRKDIADLLGTTVESICRIVHKLSESGQIEIMDASHFRLLDLPGLERTGQIEGLMDRMTRGMVSRSSRLAALVESGPGEQACSCARRPPPLTRILEPAGAKGIHLSRPDQ